MKIFTKLTEHFVSKEPIVITMGFFDGMHLGHQELFNKVRAIKGKSGFSYALTFSNHPQTVIKPQTPFPLITTLKHRLNLIENEGIDSLFLLPFTKELKETSADDFLLYLMEQITFTDFVLGPDATIGKNKEGNLELLKLLSKKYSFNLHHLQAYTKDKVVLSSTRIRKIISEGNLSLIQQYLGRPYSIYSYVIEGLQKGTQMGFPTLNFDVEGLCLPPSGVYKVELNSKIAIANLGVAPTLQKRKAPVLEVHLLESSKIDKSADMEITFKKFMRPEKKFASVDELKQQIERDIELVKTI